MKRVEHEGLGRQDFPWQNLPAPRDWRESSRPIRVRRAGVAGLAMRPRPFEIGPPACDNWGAFDLASLILPQSMAKSSASTAIAVRKRPARKKARRNLASGYGLPKKSAIRVVAPLPATGSLYSVHPGVAMMQKWIAELKPKTGCSLEEWIKHIRVMGPKDEKECRAWLQEKHKLGTNAAWWLAERALGVPKRFADDSPASYLAACPGYVDAMYAGAKAALRPLHDALVRLAKEIGEEVKVCPCQTMVPLYRHHVFAEIKPASNKRIDLGFALGDEPFTSRLVDTGGKAKKNRITHKVAITTLDDIDLQVRRWLKQAYERDQK